MANFRTDFNAQNAGNGISVVQISKFSRGCMHPDPPSLLAPSALKLRDFKCFRNDTVRILAGSAPEYFAAMICS